MPNAESMRRGLIVFIPAGESQTLAEMDQPTRILLHRARAVKNLLDQLGE